MPCRTYIGWYQYSIKCVEFSIYGLDAVHIVNLFPLIFKLLTRFCFVFIKRINLLNNQILKRINNLKKVVFAYLG